MSTPLEQLQPPPVGGGATQQAYTAHTGHGSVGPVIAVLAVVTILGVIEGMIGRLCSGRPVMGYGHYDFEGWVERKCSSCIDGTVDPPPSRPTADESQPVTVPAEETQQEIKEEEEERVEDQVQGQKQHGSSSNS